MGPQSPQQSTAGHGLELGRVGSRSLTSTTVVSGLSGHQTAAAPRDPRSLSCDASPEDAKAWGVL